MISVGEEHVDKQAATATVAAIAKKKLHKFQSKKVNQTDGLEQENIRLKEKLFKSEQRVELMEHEIQSLRHKYTQLKQFIDSELDEIQFLDRRSLESYEMEERAIFDEFKRKLSHLKERYKIDSAELCSGCIGELIEI